MAAYREGGHDSAGYSTNFLVFGREVQAPPDIVYGSPEDKPEADYDTFVEGVREKTTTAFAEVRNSRKRSAKRNKRYYNLGLKPKHFEVGLWVLYFNQRKLREK